MRKWIFCLSVFFVISCRHPKLHTTNDRCWTGTIDGNVPVFLLYQIDDDMLTGKITYLNVKDKSPLTLIGIIEDDKDKSYKFYEFDTTGNITGMITGVANDHSFQGKWESRQTKQVFPMTLAMKDTLIQSQNIMPDKDQIFGRYHFQFGDEGFKGDLEIGKVDNERVDFNILTLSNVELGPNRAEIKKDTIDMDGTSFTYQVPKGTGCKFYTRFYKGFAYVHYINDACFSQFGKGATLDMLYLKVK